LFGGFLISKDDLFWPFELFYYITPMGYYLRSTMYNLFSEASFAPCDPATNIQSSVCVNSTSGNDVLEGLSVVYPIIQNKDQVSQDIGIMIGIAMFFKVFYVLGVVKKSKQFAKIHSS
jgi:hypothetical protein